MHQHIHTNSESKQSVALSSVFASFGLTALKIIVGLLTGSLGILSEAAHSALDFLAALLTYFAVRVGDKPADLDHPYGHGKVESLSALIESGLLFLTSGWIIYEAIKRLVTPSVHIEVAWYSFAVIAISIIVDFSRSRALKKVAKATNSQALEADALHFSSDILSSVVVLFGLVFVKFGNARADAIAAIVVSALVIYAAWRLGKRTFDVLIDTAPEGLKEKIEVEVKRVDGVLGIGKLRARLIGNIVVIDLTVYLHRKNNLITTQNICNRIEARIEKIFPGADINIHTKPLPQGDETVIERAKTIAASRNHNIHNLILHEAEGKKSLNFDLEVLGDLSLGEAHKIAQKLEEELKLEFENTEVNIHIEPLVSEFSGSALSQKEKTDISEKVLALSKGLPKIKSVQDIRIKALDDSLLISLCCLFEQSLPLREVHMITSDFEHIIRTKIEKVGEVVVHADPA